MKILGIDLGTTNSACGFWIDGKVELIPNRLGEFLTPSVVGLDDQGNVSVGRVARNRLVSHPDKTVAMFKRYMGTNRSITLGRDVFGPAEIASMVVSSLKEDAEQFAGEPVTNAVISVPAYFNDNQRQATREAAELAGLKVSRLVNEPTAAALAYGLEEKEEGTFVVLDLGGGTFDVSILEYFDGVMEVHASAGDNFLGGEDFTEILFETILREFGLEKEQLTPNDRQELVRQVEEAKIGINSGKDHLLSCNINGTSYSHKVTLDEFNSATRPLLARIRKPIEVALRDANLSIEGVDDVILVGGATRMTGLRKAVGKMFRRLPLCHLDPDLVVASGAAIQAGLKQKDEALDDVVLTDVCPYTLGIETVNPYNKDESGYFNPIINRNCTVPVSRVETFYPVSESQREIIMKIFQGESRYTGNNIMLGSIKLKVPKVKDGLAAFDVRFSYDMNGLL